MINHTSTHASATQQIVSATTVPLSGQYAATEFRPWFELQRHRSGLFVARQSGRWPTLGPGQALAMVRCVGICRADLRIIAGDKESAGSLLDYMVPGHEAAVLIIDVGPRVTGLKPGDWAVVLPHVPVAESGKRLSPRMVDPRLIGLKKTRHMGWDLPGVVADALVVPAANLVRIAPRYLRRVTQLAPDLGPALFAWSEPAACTLSAYKLLEQEMQTVLEQEFLLERALIVGMGPIGILHALVLSQRGVHVWFIDSVPNRIILAQHILGKRAQAFNPDRHDADFDLVVVTAATGAALRKGEELVGSGGCLYVFSGLNRVDRAMTDRSGLFQLEAIHRAAQGLLIAPAFSHTRKRIFYLGSSGYFGGLMGEAIATVAANARELQLAVTGVIRGLPSPYIEARLPGAENQVTDGSPAIIATLNGSFDLRERHVKVLLILGHQPTGEV